MRKNLTGLCAGAALVGSLLVVPLGLAAPAALAATPAEDAARDAAYDAYQDVLVPALAEPIGWTGSVDGCVAGEPSPASQAATLAALNYARGLAGLADVTLDPALSAKSQDAALMMEAANSLSHNPDPAWPCYTTDGDEAAGASNLSLGASAARAIALYLQDPGAGNTAVGHRRWVLYPPQLSFGSGSTSRAHALYVGPDRDAGQTGPDWVPWPTAGHFPVQLEPAGRWSLSADDRDTDFSNATVTVTRNGVSLPVALEDPQEGFANDTLVWQVETGTEEGQPDTEYEVTVDGMATSGGVPVPAHSYVVTLFDAEIDARQTISFPQPADITYGEAPDLDAEASSGLPVSYTHSAATEKTCVVESGVVTVLAAGDCTLTAEQAGDDIRRAAPPVSRTFTVEKALLTVTARDQVRSPGSANPELTADFTGFVSGETLASSGVSGTPDCTTPADESSDPGVYPITCTTGSLTSDRYDFTFADGELTVGGGYTALLPARLLDTRSGAKTTDGKQAGTGAVGPAGTLNLQITGRGGVPTSGVAAVVLNVTAVNPTASGYLTVWPSGSARPQASNLNFRPGDVVPNLVIAQVGPDGKVSLYNSTGSTHLIADVVGWFPPGTGYSSLLPARLLDTRSGAKTTDGKQAGTGAVGPAGTLNLQITGRGGVPTSGVAAVVLNVTAVNPTASGYLTVWPSGSARPQASNLNFRPGDVVPNLVIAQVGPDGKVSLYNSTGSTHLIADVVGWFPPGTGYSSLLPARLLDTRSGAKTTDGKQAGTGAVGPAGTLNLQITGRGGVPTSGVAAVVLNVTAVNPTASGYLTVWPSGSARPQASNLNFRPGDVVPNLVIAQVGPDGKVSLYNSTGSTHLIADVVGWFP